METLALVFSVFLPSFAVVHSHYHNTLPLCFGKKSTEFVKNLSVFQLQNSVLFLFCLDNQIAAITKLPWPVLEVLHQRIFPAAGEMCRSQFRRAASPTTEPIGRPRYAMNRLKRAELPITGQPRRHRSLKGAAAEIGRAPAARRRLSPLIEIT